MGSTAKVDIKVVLLGQHDVGKTSIVERYLHGKFKYNVTATVGAAFGSKKVEVSGREWTLGIWDTAGAERYESMSRIYYRSARAAIVCYDLTRKASFEKVRFWVDELLKNEPDCLIFIVGTKQDLVEDDPACRQVDEEELRHFELHATLGPVKPQYFITSSKKGLNIEELFNAIAQTAVQHNLRHPTTEKIDSIDPTHPDPTPSRSCCS